MKKIDLLIGILLSFLLLPHNLPAEEVPVRKQEMRAVWLTTIHGLDWPSKPASNAHDEEVQKRELVRLLDRLEQAGVNTIFLQVRGRGTLIYPSQYETISPDFVSPKSKYELRYDPLAFAIEESKKRGMALHAWFVVMPLGRDRYVNSLPRTAYARKHKPACIRHRGEWYMDPARPETAAHLRNLVKELLDKYDVSGVHLDYIRYPDQSRDFPDMAMYKGRNKGQSLSDWRRGNIEKIVAEIRSEIDTHDPKPLLSTAVIGTYRELNTIEKSGWTAYADVYQDPAAWGKKRLIDFVVPMMYYRGNRFLPFVKDWIAVMDDTPIVMGLGAYRILRNEGHWQPQVIVEQMDEISTNHHIAGIALFRANQVQETRLGLYTEIAKRWSGEQTLPFVLQGKGTDQVEAVSIEAREEGLNISWEGASEYYTLYLTQECNEPDLKADLYLVTRKREVVLPWDELEKEMIYYIKVGGFETQNSLETIEPVGALYYYTEDEK